MEQLKLFMVLLGCTPTGRHTEQHDVFFGIAPKISDLIPDMKAFWPEAADKLHVDGWREVTYVNGHYITVVDKQQSITNPEQLYFLNLGGYKPGEMEEFHYKILSVNNDIGEAIRDAKKTTFYKHTTFADATSHVDDKYGVDVDDALPVKDILPAHIREKFQLKITAIENAAEDDLHLGYFQLHKL